MINFYKRTLEEEVRKTIFDMAAEKSLVLDRMIRAFFQSQWNVVAPMVVKMVKRFFEDGHLDRILNETNVCLITKKQQASKVSYFRPKYVQLWVQSHIKDIVLED